MIATTTMKGIWCIIGLNVRIVQEQAVTPSLGPNYFRGVGVMIKSDVDEWFRRALPIQCETCRGSSLGVFCDDCQDTGLAALPLCEVIQRFKDRWFNAGIRWTR